MLERGAGRLAVVLEHEDVGESRILLQIEHALAVREQHVGHRVHREPGERRVVPGRLDDDLVRADAVHPVEEAFARRLELALDPERRILVRHDAIRPPGPVGSAVWRPAGQDLGWRLLLAALAEGTGALARANRLGGEVGRTPRTLG